MTKLTDESQMPIGKLFKGQKMKNVPDSYLLWMYENWSNMREDVKMYIEENIESIKLNAKKHDYGNDRIRTRVSTRI